MELYYLGGKHRVRPREKPPLAKDRIQWGVSRRAVLFRRDARIVS